MSADAADLALETAQEPSGGAKSERGPATRKDQAYNLLKERITTGQYQPGSFIDDRLVAEELGTSRTPVREALLLLEAEGHVEMQPRKGVRVVPISQRDMREIYEILTALEVKAVQLIASQQPTEVGLQPLLQACKDMQTAIKAGDREAWALADDRFHCGLLELSGNAHLARTGVRYRDRVRRGHFVAVRLAPNNRMSKSLARHRELVRKLLSDDPMSAVASHNDQRVTAGTELLSNIERSKLDLF